VEKPPKKSTARELVQRAVEGAANVVPVVGGPLAVTLSTAMNWKYTRRLDAWMEDLAEAITDLQNRDDGLSFEELADDDAFADAVITAARAAQATHREEKLTALRNGVLNTLGPNAPSLDEQARFLRLVEEFTPAHLRLLAFLNDPGKTFDDAGRVRPDLLAGGRGNLLEDAMPEFKDRRNWYDLLDRDLGAAGLTNHGGLHVTQGGSSLWHSATSELGQRFLAFISKPPD
jgi:hypothetical protein